MEYVIKSLTPDLAEDYFDFFDKIWRRIILISLIIGHFQMDRHSIRVIAMHSI